MSAFTCFVQSLEDEIFRFPGKVETFEYLAVVALFSHD